MLGTSAARPRAWSREAQRIGQKKTEDTHRKRLSFRGEKEICSRALRCGTGVSKSTVVRQRLGFLDDSGASSTASLLFLSLIVSWLHSWLYGLLP